MPSMPFIHMALFRTRHLQGLRKQSPRDHSGEYETAHYQKIYMLRHLSSKERHNDETTKSVGWEIHT